MTEKEKKVLEIIARVSKRDAAALKPEQQLVADLGIDSPKALQLMCDLEEELKIEMPEDAVGRIATVGDVLALIGATTHA
ncbi:MAG: acyl carrier protein [Planctomycetota bacterium]|nr:acyl carrier protein [Planctomycetota bacterium]